MSGLIDPLIRVFETLIQGMLTLVVLAYIASTQRRWQWHLLNFGRRFADTASGALRLGNTERVIVIAVGAIGIVYYLGLLTNLASFGLLRTAHEALIKDVYEAIEFQATQKDSAQHPIVPGMPQRSAVGSPVTGAPRHWPDETSITGLSVLTVRNLWTQVCQLRHRRNPGGEGPLYYSCYMEDEAAWRQRNSEAAAAILDPLLKQARVARGTSVAALMMAVWAAVKVAIAAVCFTVLLVTERYGWRRGRSVLERVGGWLDRRFIRTDERALDPEDRALPRRPWPEARRHANRLMYTNFVVLLAAYAAFMIGLGAYKMVEREYHLMACYGSRASAGGALQGPPAPEGGMLPQREGALPTETAEVAKGAHGQQSGEKRPAPGAGR